jgi:hypothetical protein
LSRRVAVLGAAALVLSAALAPAASAEPFTLEATGSTATRGKVTAIGDFKPERDPTLRAALAVFGTPTRIVQTSTASCRVLYGAIGLRFMFVNLGGGGACDPAFTKVQNVRAFDPRWRTGRGVGIGDPIRRLWRKYPRATRHGRSWWLVKGINNFGTSGNPYPVLRATMKGGRVNSFALSVGAAGE